MYVEFDFLLNLNGILSIYQLYIDSYLSLSLAFYVTVAKRCMHLMIDQVFTEMTRATMQAV